MEFENFKELDGRRLALAWVWLFAACWDDLYNSVVMDFGVIRLHSAQESGRRYHLYDGKDKLTLVADYANLWLPVDAANRVWFAGADAAVVATLDLPEGEGWVRNGRMHTSYALIIDHAVYAIFNKYESDDDGVMPYFTIEVEGVTWLAWSHREGDALYTLYDHDRARAGVPPQVGDHMPIGTIHRAYGQYDFTISLSAQQLSFTPPLLLALIFLID